MTEYKIKKLPLVDDGGTLVGLMTARDIRRQHRLPFATRDAQGRLRVGAAIGARGDYLERAAELVKVGVDVLVIDIAHGHSMVMERALAEVTKRFPQMDVIAGNVATADGAAFLADRGATRGQGRYRARRRLHDAADDQLRRAAAAGDRRMRARRGRARADHCRRRHPPARRDRDGALVCGADTVMLGSAFAGTTEAPGDVVQKPVVVPESQKAVKVPFKVLRGMASIGAIKDRLDVEDASAIDLQAIGAEGMEVSVALRGSARPGLPGHDQAPVLVDQLRRR